MWVLFFQQFFYFLVKYHVFCHNFFKLAIAIAVFVFFIVVVVFPLYVLMNQFILKPASLHRPMCVGAPLQYVYLDPLRALARLLRSNPISSNPSLPPAAPSLPNYWHAVIRTNTHAHAAQILPLVIHVVGLLLSLLWIYAHKTPWTLLL